jgi:D-3-phosphoglycerate dehydrogenase
MLMKIMVSAPYMIPVWGRFQPIFEAAGIEVLLASVVERLSEDELLDYVGDIDGVVCGDDRFSARVLETASPRLKVISKWGTGIDGIDLKAARDFDIEVRNTPDAFTDPVADSVLQYVLMFARQGPWQDRALKRGEWVKIPSRALHECTLGVVGVGRIGKAVLKRARAFGMDLLGNDIVEIDSRFLSELSVEMVELEALLRQSDFISINCDLNPTSFQLIDSSKFDLMKPEAVLINTARGSVLEESALIRALEEGKLAGAALDVFEQEPLPADSPLRSMDNVILAAHNANSSPKAWERVHKQTLLNLFEGLQVTIPKSAWRQTFEEGRDESIG